MKCAWGMAEACSQRGREIPETDGYYEMKGKAELCCEDCYSIVAEKEIIIPPVRSET